MDAGPDLKRGFWSITRYEDALTVYRDPLTFSSQRYSVGLPSNQEAEQMLSPEMRGCGQMLIGTDPPRHNAMRKRFNDSFLPRSVAQLEASGRQTCRRDYRRGGLTRRMRFRG